MGSKKKMEKSSLDEWNLNLKLNKTASYNNQKKEEEASWKNTHKGVCSGCKVQYGHHW